VQLIDLLSCVMMHESLDAPSEIIYSHQDGVDIGTFSIDGHQYQIAMGKYEGRTVFGFRPDREDVDPDLDITNLHQNAIKIYSTVIEFIKVKLEEYKPDVWVVDASPNEKKNRLYRMIISKLMVNIKRIGYEGYYYPENQEWVFYKDGIAPAPGYLANESASARYFARMGTKNRPLWS